MAFFTQDLLDFFIELAPNNNKDWFDENRKRYEKSVKDPFKAFVTHLIAKLSKINPSFNELEAKDCIFRINRDIRFSKDKQPYKLQVSAVIAPGGKKDKSGSGVYFEIGPERLRVYGGIYELEKDDLLELRTGISENLNDFKKLYSDPKFIDRYKEIRGAKNKILPKELKEFGNIEPLIFNKQFYFFTEFTPETILFDNLDELIIDCYKVGKPTQDFFNKLIKE